MKRAMKQAAHKSFQSHCVAIARAHALIIIGLVLVGLSIFGTGCSKQNFSLEPESKTFGSIVEYNKDVDILMIVDTSGSMLKHQTNLADQIGNFVGALEKTKVDYRVAVTTMDMGNGGEGGRFLTGPGSAPAVLPFSYPALATTLAARIRAGEDSPVERGLEAMKASLSLPLSGSSNKGFLREGALLVVIVLSNEDDKSITDDYVGFLNALKPPLEYSDERSWVAHFIGVQPNDKTCATSSWNYYSPGLRYKELADASGGRSENICTADLSLAVDNIKARIIEIVTEYSLGPRKAREASILVYVNGVLLPNDETNGWTYNSSRNSITFHGSGVPAPGSLIHVDFDPEGIK